MYSCIDSESSIIAINRLSIICVILQERLLAIIYIYIYSYIKNKCDMLMNIIANYNVTVE